MFADMFTERILETENLTDNLEDPEANILLNWGIQRIPGLIQGIDDRELAGDKVNALMAFMRKVNRILGVYTNKTIDQLTVEMALLNELYNNALGTSRAITPEEYQFAASHLIQLEIRQALIFLLEWPILKSGSGLS